MKKLYLLFIFVLLFTSSYSIRPKTDKKDFSKYFFNRSMIKGNIAHQNKNDNTSRYFSFQLKDLLKESNGFIFFQINSSLSPKNISYTFIKERKERTNINRIEDYKYITWHSPYLLFKQKFTDKIIYQFAVLANELGMSQKKVIIRVSPFIKNEKCTCEIARNISGTLKNLVNNNKKDRRDISNDYKWKKPKFDRNNHHNHNWDSKSDKFDKYNHHNFDNKLDKFDKYNNKHHIHKYRKNNGRIVFAISLISIWSLIFILYCLVNRRKKPVINILKNQEQINLSQYHNV